MSSDSGPPAPGSMASGPDTLSRKRASGCCAYCSRRSPFFVAVEEGDTAEVARFLREDVLWLKQADRRDRRTAWHLAADNGHIEVLRQLVERTREEETGVVWNARRTLPMRLMSRPREMMGPDERVLELVNGRTTWGCTPLALAAAADQAETVRYLLAIGADPWQGDYEGLSPAHFAARFGAIRALQVLLEEERPISSRASCNNHPGTRYVDSLDAFGFTPLHYATWCNRRPAMMVLIGFDANLIARSQLLHSEYFNLPAGSTPLHIACLLGCLDRVKLLLRAYYETAADLLPSQTAMMGTTERRRRARSHPDPRLILTRTQRLPFHVAARCGHQHLLDWLDPSVPLMFLFGGEDANEEAEGGRGIGTGPLVGVSRLTVIAAKALHQALLVSLDTAAEDIRRHQEAVEARRRRREERRAEEEAEAAAQCLKQGKEPPPEGLRGKLRRLIERTPKATADGTTGGNAAASHHSGAGVESAGWHPWRNRGRGKRRRKVTTSGTGDCVGGEDRSAALRSPRRRSRGATAGATAATAGRLGSRSGGGAPMAAGADPGLGGSKGDSDWSTDTDASGGDSAHVGGLAGGSPSGGGGGGSLGSSASRAPPRLPPLSTSEAPPPALSSSVRSRPMRDTVGMPAPSQPPPTQRLVGSFPNNGIAVVSDSAGAGGISATEPGVMNGAGGSGSPVVGGSDSGAASSRARNMLQRLYRGPVWRRGSGQAEQETSREHAQLMGRLDRVGITIPEGPNQAVAYFSPGREPRYNMPTQIVIPSVAVRAPGLSSSPTTTPTGTQPVPGTATAEPPPSAPVTQQYATEDPESTSSIPHVPARGPVVCDADRPSCSSSPLGRNENDCSIGASTTGPTPLAAGGDVARASGEGGVSGRSTPQSVRESGDRNLPPLKTSSATISLPRSSPRAGTGAAAAIVFVSGDAAAAAAARPSPDASASPEAAAQTGLTPTSQELQVLDAAGPVHDSNSPPASCSLPFISQHLPLSRILSPLSKDLSAAATTLLGPTSPRDSSRCAGINTEPASVAYNGSVALPGAPSNSTSQVPSVLVAALSAPAVLGGSEPCSETATKNDNGAARNTQTEECGQLVDTLPQLADQAGETNGGDGAGSGENGGGGTVGRNRPDSGTVGAGQPSGSPETSRLSRVGAGALSLLDSLRSTLRRTGGQRQGQVLPVADNHRPRTTSPSRSTYRRRNRLPSDSAAPGSQSDAAAALSEPQSSSNLHVHPHATHRGVRVNSGRPRLTALSFGASADTGSPAPAADATDGDAAAASAGGNDGVRSPSAPVGRRSRASQARRSLISVARRLTGRSARHEDGSAGGRRSRTNEEANENRVVTAGQEPEEADGDQQQQHAGSDNNGSSTAQKEGRDATALMAAEGEDGEQGQGLGTAARCGSSSSLGSDASVAACHGEGAATAGGRPVVAEEEDDICPVCLDEAPNLVVQACRHSICMDCARDLVKRHGLTPALCPYCRGIISSLKARVALAARRR